MKRINKVHVYTNFQFGYICNLYGTRDRCTLAFSITKLKCVPMNDRALREMNTRRIGERSKKKWKKIK